MNRAKCPKEGVNFLKEVSGTFAVQGIENFDALVRAFSPVQFYLTNLLLNNNSFRTFILLIK